MSATLELSLDNHTIPHCFLHFDRQYATALAPLENDQSIGKSPEQLFIGDVSLTIQLECISMQ